MYAVLLHEISNVNVVQIVQFAEVHTVLHSPPVSTDILPRIPGNQDVEQRRVGRRERMFMTSPHSLPLFTTLDMD